MLLLPSTPITTAGTLITQTVDLKAGSMPLPIDVRAYMQFTYGSGGTTINVYFQTSFDGGVTWVDVISMTQITTVSSRKVSNISRLNKLAPVLITDKTLAAATANDGIIGPLWRAAVVSVGTYAGSTLRLDLIAEH